MSIHPWSRQILLLAVGLASVPTVVLAQPAEPAPPPQPAEPAPPPTPAPVETPAAPPPTPAPVETPAAPPPTSDEDNVSPLVPAWESKRLSPHPIKPKVTFKPGKGLNVASEDGEFEITTKLRAQILSTFETEGSDSESGTQIRRARVAFSGHMFGKHNKYKMELAISPRDDASRGGLVGTSPLLDWNMTFDYLKQATVVAGQYKVPFSRQRVVSSGSLQMVDRSSIQSEFNLDRNVGIDVRSTSLLDERFHYFLGFYPGEGRNAFELRPHNHVYLARAELLPFGAFEDYVEADFQRTAPRVSIGASYAYVKDSLRDQGPLGSAPADEGLTSFHTAEADVLVKAYGLSFTSEFFWRDGSREAGDAIDAMGMPIPEEAPRTGLGIFAQAGYLLPRSALELTARYGTMRPSGTSTLPERSELGAGVGYYFAHHSFKLQADYFRLWDDAGLGDGANLIRVQLEAGL